MIKSLRRVSALIVYLLKPLLKQPLTFLTIVVWPMVPMIFFAVFMGREGMYYGLVGMLVTAVSFTGIYTAQDYVFNRVLVKLQDFLVASPMKYIEYVLGESLAQLIISIPVVLIGYILLYELNPYNILLLIPLTIVLLAGYFMLMPIGFIIGSKVDDPSRVNGITNMVAIILSFFAPVYYPLDYIPPWIRLITYIIPTTHIAQLARVILNVTKAPGLGLFGHSIAVVISSAILYIISIKVGGWREV